MIQSRNIEAVLARSWNRGSNAHGEAHWYAVAATGFDLALQTRHADPEVAFLFGLLHDARRENEGRDRGHGPRAATFARTLQAEGLLGLKPRQLHALVDALEEHDRGMTTVNATVGVCWDADRLQLSRFGYKINRVLLSSEAARTRAAERRADRRRLDALDWVRLHSEVTACLNTETHP